MRRLRWREMKQFPPFPFHPRQRHVNGYFSPAAFYLQAQFARTRCTFSCMTTLRLCFNRASLRTVRPPQPCRASSAKAQRLARPSHDRGTLFVSSIALLRAEMPAPCDPPDPVGIAPVWFPNR